MKTSSHTNSLMCGLKIGLLNHNILLLKPFKAIGMMPSQFKGECSLIE